MKPSTVELTVNDPAEAFEVTTTTSRCYSATRRSYLRASAQIRYPTVVGASGVRALLQRREGRKRQEASQGGLGMAGVMREGADDRWGAHFLIRLLHPTSFCI